MLGLMTGVLLVVSVLISRVQTHTWQIHVFLSLMLTRPFNPIGLLREPGDERLTQRLWVEKNWAKKRNRFKKLDPVGSKSVLSLLCECIWVHPFPAQ